MPNGIVRSLLTPQGLILSLCIYGRAYATPVKGIRFPDQSGHNGRLLPASGSQRVSPITFN